MDWINIDEKQPKMGDVILAYTPGTKVDKFKVLTYHVELRPYITHWIPLGSPSLPKWAKVRVQTDRPEKETDCRKCIHKNVCKTEAKDQRCLNYGRARSGFDSYFWDCDSCEHYYTRYGKKKKLCFVCNDFSDRG